MDFRRYDHLVRHGGTEVEGIDIGVVHLFPKLDGTNAHVWLQNGAVKFGSRGRVLDGADNAGFRAWGERQGNLYTLLTQHPTWHIYGEWLVPHTIKQYRDEAWRRFWAFDVWCHEREEYLSFDHYGPALEQHGVDLVKPLAIVTNPGPEQLQRFLETNTELMQDGAGPGEGIVLKQYGWRNKFGEQPWAKMVRNDFKERNREAFGVNELDGSFQVELAIAHECATKALVDKTRAKIENDMLNTADPDGTLKLANLDWGQAWLNERPQRGKLIPRLIQTVFHDVVTEELWDALKRHKDPVINFKRLRGFVTAQVKTHAGELF